MKEIGTVSSQKALKLRKRAKAKKPSFARSESWRYKRLKENWRRPRGLDNKMRRKIKGWPQTPNVGYRGPKISRGLHPSGYQEVLVYKVDDLKNIDPKTQAARIAHTVGRRKRVGILTDSRKRKIVVLNLREIKTVEEEKELAEEGDEEEEISEEKEEAETEEPKQKKEKKTKGRAKKQ